MQRRKRRGERHARRFPAARSSPRAPTESSASGLTSAATNGTSARARNAAEPSITQACCGGSLRVALRRAPHARKKRQIHAREIERGDVAHRQGLPSIVSSTGAPTLRSSSSACSSATATFRARSSSTPLRRSGSIRPTDRNPAARHRSALDPRDDRRGRHHVAALRAKAQVVIHQHERQHRLGDRRGAQSRRRDRGVPW